MCDIRVSKSYFGQYQEKQNLNLGRCLISRVLLSQFCGFETLHWHKTLRKSQNLVPAKFSTFKVNVECKFLLALICTHMVTV